MGGAAKHIQHLHEDRSMTFGRLKKILRDASTGRLERVTVKFDGQNIVATYGRNGLRVARGVNDIKSGGMDSRELTKKFSGRGSVEEAFTSAFSVLEAAVRSIPQQDVVEIFGQRANVWYSFEIIHTKNPNVIVYDRNCIILHESPVIKVSQDGSIARDESGERVSKLTSYVNRMQRAVESTDWRVMSPEIAKLESMSEGVLERAIAAVDEAMASVGCADSDTLGEFVKRSSRDTFLSRLRVSDDAKDMLSQYVAGDGVKLNDIKKIVRKDLVDEVRDVADSRDEIARACMRPIELAVHDFSVSVLEGMRSSLVFDPDREVSRLKKEVADAIQKIRESCDDRAMEVLSSQLEKLKSVESITSSVEGIVFVVDKRAYKMSGNFAPVSTLLGLFKYGRNGTKLQ